MKILHFKFLDRAWGARVDKFCEGWLGTPYIEGACIPGRGVDCVRFAGSVLDHLYLENRRKDIRRVKGDTSLHNPKLVKAAMRDILRLYPKHERVFPERAVYKVNPADILVSGPENGGPGHVMVVGGAPGKIWHCSSPLGVQLIGYALPANHKLYAVFRATDRELRWF